MTYTQTLNIYKNCHRLSPGPAIDILRGAPRATNRGSAQSSPEQREGCRSLLRDFQCTSLVPVDAGRAQFVSICLQS